MRVLITTLALCSTAALAAGSGAEGAAVSKARVIFTEGGSSEPLPPRGAFALTGAAGRDSGKTVISPGPEGVRVSATEFFYGRHGKLTVTFTGVRAVGRYGVNRLRGTWRVLAGFGTGMYKSWKGSGTWVGTENGNRYTLRFEGLVTRTVTG
jgi:hypothetical protein